MLRFAIRPIMIVVALAVIAVAAGPDRTQAAAGKDAAEKSSRQQPAKAAAPVPLTLSGHGGPVKALAVDPQGSQALSGSFDYSMILWDLTAMPSEADNTTPKTAGDLKARLDPMEGAVNAVGFVPGTSGGLLAAGDDGSLWHFTNNGEGTPGRMKGHTAKVVGLDVSADGKQAVTASWDRTARVWSLAEQKAGAVLEGHQGPVNAAVFSADTQSVFTASYDGRIRRYGTSDGQLDRAIHKHGWGINVLARLNDDDLLVFGALDGSVGLVDGRSGDEVKKLASHEKPVLAIAVSREHGLIATAGGDGKIRVWKNDGDGFTGAWGLLEEFENPYGPIWALAFNKAATAVYYGGLDDVVHVWLVRPRQPFEVVESSYPRRFQLSGDPDDPVAKGELQFARKCSVCHTLKPDGRNRAGPTLHGIFGRRIASLPGYNYSEPLKHLDIVWTEETVSRLFEVGPDKFTPGSKMPLQKMADKSERDALIAFLKAATQNQPDKSGAAGN